MPGSKPFLKNLPFSINILCCLLVLSLTSHCQNFSQNANNDTPIPTSTNSIGSPVTEMSKSLMIIFQDSKNNYWFGSMDQGAYKYDGNSIIKYSKKDGLASNRIRRIQEDGNGNLYFDTGEGISKFDGQKFTTLTIANQDTSKDQWKLAPGDLWFEGSWNENGPYRYDGTSLYHLEFPRHKLHDVFYSKYPNAPYSPYEVYTIYKDSIGNIWFGTAVFGVCRFDGQSLSWISEEELTELDDGPSNGVRGIIEDKDSRFWLGNTLYRYEVFQDSNNEAMGFKKLKGIEKSNGVFKIDFPYFMSIIKDKNQHLWMASYDQGVWKYDGETVKHYWAKSRETNKPVTLYSIYKDRLENIWLGTQSEGVFKFDGQEFIPFVPDF